MCEIVSVFLYLFVTETTLDIVVVHQKATFESNKCPSVTKTPQSLKIRPIDHVSHLVCSRDF